MPGSTHFHPANKFFQIKITTFTLILIIGLALVSAGSAMAGSSYTNAFNNRYGTSGSSGGLTLGSCITCHTSRSPGGSNKATNNYGRDFRNASHNFAAIESLDSDGDGYTNLTEILANAFPGDAASTPTPALTPPVANAGPNQTVDSGTLVTLNGAQSYDPDGNIVRYAWTQTGGTTVTLSSGSATSPTFTAPVVASGAPALTFRLTVTDNDGQQAAATCSVTVNPVSIAPVADAGPDQTVASGDLVTLDGSNSYDSDGSVTSYNWTQISGSTVNMANASTARPTFTAPNAGSGGAALTFQLTVTDNSGLQSTDTCIINVSSGNLPPVADAGVDFSAEEGTTVTLDGTYSSDPDDGIATYLWEVVTPGVTITFSDPTAVQPTFVTPEVISTDIMVTFRLTVEDHAGLRSSDEVSVTIFDNGITGFPTGVLTLVTTQGQPIGITAVSGGTLIKVSPMSPSALPGSLNPPADFPLGLLDLAVKTNTPGGKVTVTLYFQNPAPTGYSWYKYNAGTNAWVDYARQTDTGGDFGAAFNADRSQVTLTFVDGGMGDDDGLSDGTILDPSGLAAAAASTGGSGSSAGANSFSSGGGGCFISAVRSGSLPLLPLALVLLTLVNGLFGWLALRRLKRRRSH